MTRPFRVLGIQQVAIGSPDKSRLRRLWVDMLGLEVTGRFRSERENVDEDIAVAGRGAAGSHAGRPDWCAKTSSTRARREERRPCCPCT